MDGHTKYSGSTAFYTAKTFPKTLSRVCKCFVCSKEYASQLAGHIDGNSTLDAAEYLFHASSKDLLYPGGAVRQTGSSHVSVIGPDNDFVAATVLVAN